MDLNLKGKTAIITGASGGIGRGLALAFAAEGCNTVLACRDTAKGEEVAAAAAKAGAPGPTLVVATDVTKRESVDAMVEKVLAEFGQIDVLVNNAGGVHQPCGFLDQDLAGMQWEIDLNIWGVIHCTQAVGRHMMSRGYGSIVNVSSNSSLLGEAAEYVANYGGTKGYVNSLTKGLAYEWAGTGLRVNTIAPGWIVPWEEDQVSENSFWRRFGYEQFGTPEQMRQQAEAGSLFNMSNQPIRRVGRPEDIANLALYFASDVSSFVTGHLVSVSGGVYMP